MLCCKRLVLAVLATTAVSQWSLADVTDAQVRQAAARMEQYLWQEQDAATGRWDQEIYAQGIHAGGVTALVTQALLVNGVGAQHPRLAPTIAYLQRTRLQGTYAVAVRAHVWAQLPEAYHRNLLGDTQWLLRLADKRSQFRYAMGRRGSVNHSLTHFGALGVWEGAKRGVAVPDKFWLNLEDYFLDVQLFDGGWGYSPGSDSYGSMTAAGLTVLLLTQQQAHRRDMQPDPRLTKGIADALAWFDAYFEGPKNPRHGRWNYYYLFALERAALAGGVRYLNDLDWFQTGASYIIETQEDDGSLGHSPVHTALGLIFLARGRKPLWVTKLTVPEHNCNSRPNDIFFLSEYLSDLREGELSWQTLSVDAPVEAWHAAPLAYLSTDRRIRLTREQKASIKRYLDCGGTLLANPDNGDGRFADSIRELAAELYPQWPMRPLPPDHPVYRLLEQVKPDVGRSVAGMTNGVRELIVLPDSDWGALWQTGRLEGRAPAWRLATNLWALVTDRGVLPGRLVRRFQPRQQRPVTGDCYVAQVRYAGNWLPEPATWELFADTLFNRTGIELFADSVDLAQLGEQPMSLAHLVGVDPIELTEVELKSIEKYLAAGNTLLVETAGGRGRFARSVEKQLAAQLKTAAQPIPRDHPLITGQGLANGYDNTTVQYRRYAVARLAMQPRPHLAAIVVHNRPAVIITEEDLSQGMLNINHWGIAGYTPHSARQLATNIVLWARRTGAAAGAVVGVGDE